MDREKEREIKRREEHEIRSDSDAKRVREKTLKQEGRCISCRPL